MVVVEITRGVVANVQKCHILVSSNSSHAIMFPFRLMPLGKGMKPLPPHQLLLK